MKFASGKLWHHQNFMRLWVGETVEWFGDQITFFALPSIAAVVFKADAFNMGILFALEYLAFPVLGTFVGVLGDRWPRRPMMIVANIVQVVVLSSIPIAFLLGYLTLFQLFVVATIMGISSVFFAVAYQSYLPSLVERQNLIEANSKLQASESAANVGGPSLWGSLTQLFGPALSIAADALATLIAAFAIFSISKPEQSHSSTAEGDFSKELREGAHVVFSNPLLRNLAASTATLNLGSSIFLAIVFLFMYIELQFSYWLASAVFAVGGIGLVIGSVSAPKFARKGIGRALAVSLFTNGVGLLAIPIASYSPAASAPILAMSLLVSNVGLQVYNVNQISLRQAMVPDRLQGRMNATMRTIVWSALPVGAFIGGILGTQLGIVRTIIVSALVSMLSVVFIILGPVWSLREVPETMHPGEQSTARNMPSQ